MSTLLYNVLKFSGVVNASPLVARLTVTITKILFFTAYVFLTLDSDPQQANQQQVSFNALF